MQRSTSKLLARAGSLRNMNRTGYKFRFTLRPESLDKLNTTSAVVLVWQRSGGKSSCTTIAKVDKERVARFDKEGITQDVVLYKKRKSGADIAFEERVYKLVVRADTKDGRAVARIELDFAQYADVPSFSKRVAAVMSHGGRLVMSVSSSFEGEVGKQKKRKGGTGSKQGSDVDSAAGSDDRQSAANADADADSLEKLMDGLEPEEKPKETGGKKNVAMGVAKKGSSRQTSPVRQAASSPGGSMSFNDFTGNAPGRTRNGRSTSPTQRLGPAGGVESAKGSVERETIERLDAENQALRKSLAELSSQLGREPVYKDLVRELTEAKMALAILTLEKDELHKEVRELKEAALKAQEL